MGQKNSRSKRNAREKSTDETNHRAKHVRRNSKKNPKQKVDPGMKLYHSVYVKRPIGRNDPSQHNFYIVLHTADEKPTEVKERTLRSPGMEILAEPQIIYIRPPYTFTAMLTCDNYNISSSDLVEYDVKSAEDSILRIFMVNLKKIDGLIPMTPYEYLNVNYAENIEINNIMTFAFQWSLSSLSYQNQEIKDNVDNASENSDDESDTRRHTRSYSYSGREAMFPQSRYYSLPRKMPRKRSSKSSVINASGNSSIGIQMNYYGSDHPSNFTFS